MNENQDDVYQFYRYVWTSIDYSKLLGDKSVMLGDCGMSGWCHGTEYSVGEHIVTEHIGMMLADISSISFPRSSVIDSPLSPTLSLSEKESFSFTSKSCKGLRTNGCDGASD